MIHMIIKKLYKDLKKIIKVVMKMKKMIMLMIITLDNNNFKRNPKIHK